MVWFGVLQLAPAPRAPPQRGRYHVDSRQAAVEEKEDGSDLFAVCLYATRHVALLFTVCLCVVISMSSPEPNGSGLKRGNGRLERGRIGGRSRTRIGSRTLR